MTLASNKKIYFLSDFHLGAPDAASSLQREKQVVRFLNEIKNDAAEIFIVGDMFDFWYESVSYTHLTLPTILRV